MIYNMYMYNLLCCIEICISKNFPETAWRHTLTRQATHSRFT